MSVVDWINHLVVGRMRRSEAPPAVIGNELVLGGERIALAEATDMVAHEVDVHAGTLIALTLSFRTGRTVTLTQDEACWTDLLAALDRLALTRVPSRDWVVAVMAGGPAGRTIVLRRDGRAAS